MAVLYSGNIPLKILLFQNSALSLLPIAMYLACIGSKSIIKNSSDEVHSYNNPGKGFD